MNIKKTWIPVCILSALCLTACQAKADQAEVKNQKQNIVIAETSSNADADVSTQGTSSKELALPKNLREVSPNIFWDPLYFAGEKANPEYTSDTYSWNWQFFDPTGMILLGQSIDNYTKAAPGAIISYYRLGVTDANSFKTSKTPNQQYPNSEIKNGKDTQQADLPQGILISWNKEKQKWEGSTISVDSKEEAIKLFHPFYQTSPQPATTLPIGYTTTFNGFKYYSTEMGIYIEELKTGKWIFVNPVEASIHNNI